MRMVDLIIKKQEGKALTKEEIRFIIAGYTDGSIPDYQMSAWAMAVFFQDMTDEERMKLTMAMAESGDQIDLSAIEAGIYTHLRAHETLRYLVCRLLIE